MPPEQIHRNRADVYTAVFDLLTVKLGPFIARTAISMAAKHIGKATEALTLEDIPALSEALRPALQTLMGKQNADALIRDIRALSE
jgi:hypothetical protein